MLASLDRYVKDSTDSLRPGSWGTPVLLCGCVARSLPRLA